MKTGAARELGRQVAALAHAEQIEEAYDLLAPVLAERTPFRLLELVGDAVGAGPVETTNRFVDRVAAEGTEGGWVVIGSALRGQLDRGLEGPFDRCRRFIVVADVWYGADILGERVPGPALVAHFEPALHLLPPWREDENRWVRRALGVAVHFWAKRSRGAAERAPQAEALLTLLTPAFEEWQMDAAKGIGWGLKTLGKHYPERVAGWLIQQAGRRHRAVMLRKALTYLPEEQRAWVDDAFG